MNIKRFECFYGIHLVRQKCNRAGKGDRYIILWLVYIGAVSCEKDVNITVLSVIEQRAALSKTFAKQ